MSPIVVTLTLICLNVVFTNTESILGEEKEGIMLCDICKVREAKVHKTVRGTPIFGKKPPRPKHFCEECFELVSQKIGPGLPVKKPEYQPRKINGDRE
jgi:hypothetical protein